MAIEVAKKRPPRIFSNAFFVSVYRYVSKRALSRGELTINEEQKSKHAILEGAVRAKGSAVEAFMTVGEFMDLGLSEVCSQPHVGLNHLSAPF